MKIWRTVLRLILVLLAVGLALLIAYGLWWLVSRYWAPILFWGYFTVGAFCLLIAYWFLRRIKRIDNPQGKELLPLNILNALTETSSFDRWRKRIAMSSTAVASTLTWPLMLLLGVLLLRQLAPENRAKYMQQNAQQRLNPSEVQLSVALLLVVGALFGAHRLFALPDRFGSLLLLIVATVCTAKLLSYAVSPISLPAQLRRSPRKPFVSFVIVAVCFFALLVLCFAGYANGVPNVRYEHLKATALDLLQFRRGYALYSGERITALDYFLTAAGFLYYITLFQTLRAFDKFKRNDEDVNALAGSYLSLGKFKEAISWLGKAQVKDKTNYSLRAAAYLGNGQLTKAVEAAKQSYYMDRDETLDTSGGYHNAVVHALIFPLPESHVLRALDEWLKAGAKESEFIDAIDGLIVQGLIPPEKVGDLFAQDDRALKYALSSARCQMHLKEFDKAREMLESLPPAAGINELLRHIFLLMTRITPDTPVEQDAISIDDWAGQSLPTVKELGLGLSDDRDRVMAILSLHSAMLYALKIGSPRAGEIGEVAQEIKGSIVAEDYGLQAERATSFMQQMTASA